MSAPASAMRTTLRSAKAILETAARKAPGAVQFAREFTEQAAGRAVDEAPRLIADHARGERPHVARPVAARPAYQVHPAAQRAAQLCRMGTQKGQLSAMGFSTDAVKRLVGGRLPHGSADRQIMAASNVAGGIQTRAQVAAMWAKSPNRS